jgi:hypothetical protein
MTDRNGFKDVHRVNLTGGWEYTEVREVDGDLQAIVHLVSTESVSDFLVHVRTH